ncbi:hypothetical protein SSAG_00232 [Streptomyces sp. Mg1]|nr:hypothetical protein SSAG_00232 [Streptomyces sp. Mg1]
MHAALSALRRVRSCTTCLTWDAAGRTCACEVDASALFATGIPHPLSGAPVQPRHQAQQQGEDLPHPRPVHAPPPHPRRRSGAQVPAPTAPRAAAAPRNPWAGDASSPPLGRSVVGGPPGARRGARGVDEAPARAVPVHFEKKSGRRAGRHS